MPPILDDQLYYVYSSQAGKPPGENQQTVDKDKYPNTDNFVGFLNGKVVILKSAPTPGNPNAVFSDTDEWQKWFYHIDLKDLSLNVKFDTPKDETGKFDIQSFKCALLEPWNITFSSAADVLLFTFGPLAIVDLAEGAKVPIPGIDESGKYLYCGLDANATGVVTTTVKELFTLVGLNLNDFSSLPDGMGDVGATIRPEEAELKRNALWFDPEAAEVTTMRLQFKLDSVQVIATALSDLVKGFELSVGDIVCKKVVTLMDGPDGPVPVTQGSIAFSVGCSITTRNNKTYDLAAAITLYETSFNLTILVGLSPADLLSWVADVAGFSLDFVNEILAKEEVFNNVLLRRIRMSFGVAPDTGKLGLYSFDLDIEVLAKFGSSDSQQKVAFILRYSWVKGIGESTNTIVGELWNWFDFSPDRNLSPDYETWTDLQPTSGAATAKSIDLKKIIVGQDIQAIPESIPTQLSTAFVVLSTTTFTIGATIQTDGAPNSSKIPQPRFGEVGMVASFSWGAAANFSLSFKIDAELLPSPASKNQQPATLLGALTYDSSGPTWKLTASLKGLYASTLYELFDSSYANDVMSLIDSISIRELTLEYSYTSAPSPLLLVPDNGAALVIHDKTEVKSTVSSLKLYGDIIVSVLELELNYDYDENGWEFNASLRPKDKEASLSAVLANILGDNSLLLPDFLSDTVFSGKGKNDFTISVSSSKEGDLAYFQFHAILNLGSIALSFFQYHGTAWGAKVPPKRLLKVGFTGFPDTSVEIPLVGSLSQPFEEMYYAWVQDDTNPGSNVTPGITRTELDLINKSLGKDRILVKDGFKPQSPTDVLLSQGSHLAVVVKDTGGNLSCILDYAFMKATKASPPKIGSLTDPSMLMDASADESGEGVGTSASAPFKKKSGPLSISNIGLKYMDKKLHIKFDAIFDLGPLGFSLIGFEVIVGIKSVREIDSWAVAIEGLSVAFERAPLTIAGIIRRGKEPGLDYYAGGMIVGFVPYQLMAAGFYGKAIPDGKDGGGNPYPPFTSIFIFAKLNGPLVELEFGEISGVTGGFGYNSTVRVPTAEKVIEFPFVAPNALGDSAGSAIETLQKITDPKGGWFSPLQDNYWAAAGMKIDAFQMISLDAVVVVQFGGSIKLGIFAVAIADIPSPKSPVKYAHVELGIAVTVDFDYGVLKAEAQLSPQSFILHPDCHLTGGFALYYWFDAPHADDSKIGDFVLTVGGYHQAYIVPKGYPNPPRLAINWSWGSNISITGQAYFAITPHVCMGGGRIHAAYNAGDLSAWFDAYADFLINYKPFHFNATAGISVGVSYNLNLLFVQKKISVELSAGLELWGPPLAGRVTVEFYIVTFHIDFGDAPKGYDKVDLLNFYLLVLQASSQSTRSAGLSLTAPPKESRRIIEVENGYERPENEGHIFLAETGLMNTSDKTNKEPRDPWIVRGGSFSFVVGCKMAVDYIEQPDKSHSIQFTEDKIYGKPMHLVNPMTSTMTVNIKQNGVQVLWRMDKYIKSVPQGLWAKYDPNQDPLAGGKDLKELLNPKTSGSKTLMMGVLFTAPPPQLSPDKLPVYEIKDASYEDIPAEKPFPDYPEYPEANPAWKPTKPLEGPAQWTAVRDTWVAPGLGTGPDGQRGFIDGWIAAFKWGDALSTVSFGIPKTIKDNFDKLYVAAPLITV